MIFTVPRVVKGKSNLKVSLFGFNYQPCFLLSVVLYLKKDVKKLLKNLLSQKN